MAFKNSWPYSRQSPEPSEERRNLTSTRGRPRYDDILTPREWQVVDLLEQGLTNEQIAETLQISFGGAKFHVAEIISKLGAEDRHEAVRLARERKRARAGLLGWILIRLRFASGKPVLVGGAATVAVAAFVLLLGALLNWVPRSSSGGPDDPGLGQAIADFESGDSRDQFLAQAQFDPNDCATGEEANNPRSPSGFVRPLQRDFNTFEEAERFLCLPLPRPRTQELQHRRVSAGRSADLEKLIASGARGRGRGWAMAIYLPTRGKGRGLQFEVVSGDLGTLNPGEIAEDVSIQGTTGRLYRDSGSSPTQVLIAWEKNGYSFHASSILDNDFKLEDFLAMLETVS
jgi:DNA-binding CsgD family transcriptional regulator